MRGLEGSLGLSTMREESTVSDLESVDDVFQVAGNHVHRDGAVGTDARLAGQSISCPELRYLIASRTVRVVELAGEQMVALSDIEAYLARHGFDAAGVQSEAN